MKQSKAQAQYQDGSPKNCCGYCVHYSGGTCRKVEGAISPYKICNLYKPYRNPRRGLYSIVEKVTAATSDDWTS
jgi:hypothetical protein